MGRNISEKIALYYQNDPQLSLPSIGDSIFFNAGIVEITNNSNPGEFNFARYMKDNGIIYSTFVQRGKIRFGGNSCQYKIRRLASHVQLFIENKLREHSIQGKELAVISALFAGDRSMIDYETNKSYISSGVVHILSVSGLHVGILFMFLSVLLGKKNSNVTYTILRLIIILATIWFYAFITGLSPPVLRASVMFSLLLAGKSFNRQINSYNILAGSALLILIIAPSVLFQVGFQLSYLAVLGIILFQSKISGLFEFENTILDRIWQLTAVGIAAQLATLPLCLYYFHQFPVYFWLTNILVIPLTWLITMGTILFFFILPIHGIAGLVAFLVNVLLKLMNYIVLIISGLPFSIITNVRFGTFSLIIISIALISAALIYTYGKKKNISFFLGIFTILILSSGILNFIKDEMKNEILIYNARKGIAISFIDGHKHLILGNTESIDNYKAMSLRLNNFWVERNINKEITIINYDTITAGNHIYSKSAELFRGLDGLYINFKKKNLFIPDKSYKNDSTIDIKPALSEKYYLLITNSLHSINFEMVQNKFKKIIVTENIRNAQRIEWKNISERSGIDYFDVTTEGAFRINTEIE